MVGLFSLKLKISWVFSSFWNKKIKDYLNVFEPKKNVLLILTQKLNFLGILFIGYLYIIYKVISFFVDVISVLCRCCSSYIHQG